MNQVMIDIWPYLLPPILLVIGWLFRQIFALKSELDVANKTIDGLKADLKSKIEGLEEKMQNTIENLEKIIDSIQKRQDSHSKKQDDIPARLLKSLEQLILYSFAETVGIIDNADQISPVCAHIEPAAESVGVFCPVTVLSAHLHMDYVHR